jgi:DNA primase
MISESTIDKIKARAKIEDLVHDAKQGYGANKLYCKCPACDQINDKKKTGLIIFTAKQTAKCYKCQVYYSGAIDFVMKTDALDYPEALKKLAAHYAILVDEVADPKPETLSKGHKKAIKRAKKADEKAADQQPETENTSEDTATTKPGRKPNEISFCNRQLKESGLTYDDIRVETVDDSGTIRFPSPFLQGTRDQYGHFYENRGDDVLIKYFDLEGRPVMYKPEKQTVSKPLIRVRWQNPELHLSKENKPMKYQSPAGSGSHVYIPERLRKLYKQGRNIKRLYIQEGEKKAEKSCKHDIWSVGIMGIHNLGQNGRLPDEIQMIVQRCMVKEVCFILDSDWQDISDDLENGKAVDNRPLTFFYAVKIFKEYLRTLANLGHPVEIYFGHINANEQQEKGIDDLLAGSLAGKEETLKTDIEYSINDKNGLGQFLTTYKITMLPDVKLADFWLLNDAEKFADLHREKLKTLSEFRIKKLLRRFNEQGKLELAQKLLPDEEFWDEDVKVDKEGNERKSISFNYVRAMNFLQNRGFYRYLMKSGEKILTHIENRTLKVIDHTDVKDYTKDFCREIKRLDVLNMLMKGGPQYLGPEKLSNLDLYRPTLEKATAEKQCLYFQDKIWEISASGIKEINYGQFNSFVWNENIIRHKVKALPLMIDVKTMNNAARQSMHECYAHIDNDEFFIDYTADGEQCHFLSFLRNTSVMNPKEYKAWKKLADENPDYKPTTAELRELISRSVETNRHILNKLTATGYLLHDWKNDNERKAVIAMDAKLSEVGSSNGRTGKSLHGKAISKLIPQVYIDGKQKDIEGDKFLWHEVSEKTRNVFVDDIRAHFVFESMFAVITGQMTVNQKSGLRFTLSDDETPKILITTNHAIDGQGSSFTDRQAFIAYSDWYNDNWKPVDDFGITFFSEWDADQWNLFYNLMANCLVLYFRSKENAWSGSTKMGIVPPPLDNINMRRLRQVMGENFLTWADAYFDWDSEFKTGNLNSKHVRKELFDKFLDECPQERKYCTTTTFKNKMEAYCKFKGYHLNPHKPNKDGISFPDFHRVSPDKIFFGEMDKSGGKEYWTIANEEFNETF